MKLKNVRERQWRNYVRAIGGKGYWRHWPRSYRRQVGQPSAAVIYTQDN